MNDHQQAAGNTAYQRVLADRLVRIDQCGRDPMIRQHEIVMPAGTVLDAAFQLDTRRTTTLHD